MRSIAIISHTPHYHNNNGEVVGLEPTLREINQLLSIFDFIYHVAPLYKSDPHKATIPYKSNKVKFIPIIPTGGETFIKKIGIIFYMPYNLYIIIKIIRQVEWIHFRAPTNLGVFVLPLLSLFVGKNKWVKYAGNWQQESIPISYKFQRWWLRKNLQNGNVIINGNKKKLQSHLIPFHNPCLTEKEIITNKKFGLIKTFDKKLTFCFVGRLEESKGFLILLEAVKGLSNIKWINKLHFVGETMESEFNDNFNYSDNIQIIYHGILNRQGIDQVYRDSHFIILPSYSEGFPKVLIEASSFGCIPIVSPISSIIKHINSKKKNGIILDDISCKSIIKTIEGLNEMRNELTIFSSNAMENAKQFSYEQYNRKIVNEIIKN